MGSEGHVDLGSHFNINKTHDGATLTKRMWKATVMAKKLRWMKLSRARKEHIIRSNILPAGLYGVEAAHIDMNALNALRSAVAKVFGPASAKRGVDMAFNCTIAAKDLDPLVHIMYLRVIGIRRAMVTNNMSADNINKILDKYKDKGDGQNEARASGPSAFWREEGVLLTDSGKDDDETICHDGPLSMLIDDIEACGCWMDQKLNVHAEGEVPIDLINMLIQH